MNNLFRRTGIVLYMIFITVMYGICALATLAGIEEVMYNTQYSIYFGMLMVFVWIMVLADSLEELELETL